MVRTGGRKAEPRCCRTFMFAVWCKGLQIPRLWVFQVARGKWRELGLLRCRGPAAQQLAVHFLPRSIQKWVPRDQAFGHTHEEAKLHVRDVNLLWDGFGS